MRRLTRTRMSYTFRLLSTIIHSNRSTEPQKSYRSRTTKNFTQLGLRKPLKITAKSSSAGEAATLAQPHTRLNSDGRTSTRAPTIFSRWLILSRARLRQREGRLGVPESNNSQIWTNLSYQTPTMMVSPRLHGNDGNSTTRLHPRLERVQRLASSSLQRTRESYSRNNWNSRLLEPVCSLPRHSTHRSRLHGASSTFHLYPLHFPVVKRSFQPSTVIWRQPLPRDQGRASTSLVRPALARLPLCER